MTVAAIALAAVLGGAQTSAAAAHEGVCAGTRFVVSSGELWRDNESVGRSGHMGHALVYCGNGRVLDFASNCAGMERASGHSGYGWMEYRISDDYGRTFGPVRVLPCSRRMYDEGRHTALCEKAVRAPDGRIVLFFQITDMSRPISCEPWSEPLMAVSDDCGETFSDFMPTGADAGRIYDAVCDDRYVYFILQSSPNFPGSKPEHVYKVYRAGADLKFTPHVLPIDPVGRGYGALEFAADGTLHAYAYNSRNETEMDLTTSRDCGETWSAPRTSRVAMKIRNPQVRRLGGTWFLIGRNGGFGKGDALAFYSSPDGVNWDGGVKLDVRPDGTGTGYYGCMLPIFEPGRPPRMLMQYSRPYKSSCVNVIHRTITLQDVHDVGNPDFRPPFDKSDYKGTVGVQVNPWFPLNKAPSHALGGPNVPWKHYEGKNLWAQGMADLLPYGITAWVPEINEPTAWTGVWSDFYKQGDAENVPVKVGMFFGFYSKKNGVEATQDETTRQLQRVFKAVGVDVRTHPRTNRAGGNPVVVVYNVKKYSPEEWGRQFAKIDAAVGRNVYLMDAAGLAFLAQTNTQVAAEVDANFERLLRAHLPYWDGISAYANGFRVPYKVIKRVMKDYPQKLYEGMVHQTYTCHFQTGGNEVDLSRNWRDSIDECLESDPDAMLLTNLFDHYENSIVLPCYDREDFLLRYFECRTAKWRGKEFRKQKTPELVVTSYQSILLGRQDLDFEVVSFPIDNAKKDVVLHLDVCDTSGKVLHEFPARSVKLDGLHVERFSLPSMDFAGERGVVPRLRYEWGGKARAMNFGPMTLIDPSMRPYRLYWARSTRNELRVDGTNDWRMDGVAPGGTHHPRTLGITQFASAIKTVHQGDRRSLGCKRYGVKRDNVEMYFRDDSSKSLAFALTLPTPAPGRALHWYYMEMENGEGLKYQTLPIWETDGSEESRRMVKVPVWKKDGTIADVEVESARVPFWHYAMDDDYGRLLVDVSGWGHNGAINGRSGLGGGHLGYTGYNHYHNGPVGMPAKGERTLWRKGADGKGYLEFNGSNDYLIVQGGTAFPGAFTYEMAVRPAEIGREMGLLGTCNHQIHLDLLADGRVKAWRASPREGANGVRTKDADKWTSEVTSEMKLEAGKWAKIAVAYDLREMALYIDGVKCGSAKSPPAAGHEWLNFLMVGAKCEWVWTPTERFKGDIGEMRFTGRSLAKSELAR